MSDRMGKLAWENLGSFVWSHPFATESEVQGAMTKYRGLFLEYGISLRLGMSRAFSTYNGNSLVT